MMEFNPSDLSYAGLFVAMLVYVIRSNDKRETKYNQTIDADHQVLREMVTALNDNAEIKESVKQIKAKLWGGE